MAKKRRVYQIILNIPEIPQKANICGIHVVEGVTEVDAKMEARRQSALWLTHLIEWANLPEQSEMRARIARQTIPQEQPSSENQSPEERVDSTWRPWVIAEGWIEGEGWATTDPH